MLGALKIALRNILRNARRTALNMVMIAGGVSAIILFRGFSKHILIDLRETTIKAQTSHLQLATRGFWDKSASSPKQALLKNYQRLVSAILKVPHVKSASGRIGFYGLVSTGDRTLSTRGISLDPVAERERLEALHVIQGRPLAAGNPFQVILGGGLAHQLKVTVGQSVTILAYTYDGVVNALDMEVVGIFQAGMTEIDDTTLMLPLSAAQRLLDTGQVEQVIVGLDDTENTDSALRAIERIVPSIDPTVVVKPWYALSPFYHQVASYFATQNRIFAFIILSLVGLGVLNTVGMSVFERVGEIGTLRALGETERGILGQFVLEGGILGLVGALSGVISGTLMAWGINALHLPIVVPSASLPLKIRIDLFFGSYREAVLLAVCAAILAAVFPALRASKMNIVDALRRNV